WVEERRVVLGVRRSKGVDVPLGVGFNKQTVVAFAGEVEQRRRGGEAAVEVIGRVARDGELPLSYAQQRLWFIDQLEPGGAMYNLPTALRVRGELRRELLEQGVGGMVGGHEGLGTKVGGRDGQAAAVVDGGGEGAEAWGGGG